MADIVTHAQHNSRKLSAEFSPGVVDNKLEPTIGESFSIHNQILAAEIYNFLKKTQTQVKTATRI